MRTDCANSTLEILLNAPLLFSLRWHRRIHMPVAMKECRYAYFIIISVNEADSGPLAMDYIWDDS